VNLLLDTVTFLWILQNSASITPKARMALADSGNQVFLSAASMWEIVVKNALGKLPLPETPERLIPRQRQARGIATLPITEAATLRLRQLPNLHKDPFDRILACQAIEHGMVILTPDPVLHQYPVRSLW
jgi:PIN domain nuclease of toxin-antitoxin system